MRAASQRILQLLALCSAYMMHLRAGCMDKACLRIQLRQMSTACQVNMCALLLDRCAILCRPLLATVSPGRTSMEGGSFMRFDTSLQAVYTYTSVYVRTGRRWRR